MIFNKILLKNFGPFLGEQSIDISTDSNRNVTIIHAQNYVGKTSILRGIIWCLYGVIIPGDDGSDVDVLNSQAKLNSEYEVMVGIDFEHEGKNYKFERKIEYQMLPNSKTNSIPSFVGYEIDKYGHHTSDGFLNEPGKVVNFFAPQELSKFFFLKGENSPLNKNNLDLRDSIKEILGFNILDQANKDLVYLANSYQKSASKFINSKEINELKEKIENYHKMIDEDEATIKNCQEAVEEADDVIDGLQTEISEWQKLQGEKKLLTSVTKEIKKNEDAREELLVKKAKWFRKNLFSLLSKDLCESGIEKIDAEIHRGKIPSKYQESFINELLEDQLCICGTKLIDETPARISVQDKLTEGGDTRVYEAVMDAKSILKQMNERRVNLTFEIQDIESQIESRSVNIDSYESQAEDLKKKVDATNNDEMQKKLKELNTARSMKTSEKVKLDRARQHLKVINDSMISDQKNYERLASKNADAKEKIEISNLVKLLKLKVNEFVDGMQEGARIEIAKEMNEIVKKSITEPPTVTVNKNFCYEVDKYVSGGPKRVLDFAYTASILSFNSKSHKMLKQSGVVIPLVVDSAFGETDEEYRKALAEFLPRLSPQLIILVSGTQGYMFADALGEKIGSEYVLLREVKHEFSGENKGMINIRGNRIQTKFFEKENERTLIKKLEEVCPR